MRPPEGLYPPAVRFCEERIFHDQSRNVRLDGPLRGQLSVKLKLSTQEFTIELERAVSAPAAPVIPAAAAAPAAPAAAEPEGDAITAPMVGTFYAAPAPDQPPFVKVGDRVTQGPARVPAGGHEDDERDPRPL